MAMVAHLGFPEGGALRRRGSSAVPLGQLVEESRTSPRPASVAGPHHLLTSSSYSPAPTPRLKSNSQIQAEPAALHFNGFVLGKDYQKVLYRLIPGLAYTVKVHFCPDEWRYFYDCVRIHCQGEDNLLIPVHAYPVIDDLRIPPLIHMPSVPLGHRVSHSLPLHCSCPVDFEFQVNIVQAHPAFQPFPVAALWVRETDK
ncbi:hypothetical protein CRUP_037822 [Coryphaenoides rupestris]|nr:hypothetical protein CRUP_037822 [Coryphaenoides rupestris]